MRGARRLTLVLLSLVACAPSAAGGTRVRDLLLSRVRHRASRSHDDVGSIERWREWVRQRSGERAGLERGSLGGVPVAIWRPKNIAGPAPLVIFSHGLHGMATQSTFLTQALADSGYLVIAPDHRDAPHPLLASGGSWKPAAPLHKPNVWSDKTYADRRDDIRTLVKVLHSSREWMGRIDWNRFSLAGHSLGGYTVLGLAGAWPSWELPGVKAVLALSPYVSPFLQSHTLSSLDAPVMYQTGTCDPGVSPYLRRPQGAFDQTPSPACLVVIDGANHFSFSDMRRTEQTSVVDYAVRFLNQYVNGLPGLRIDTPSSYVSELRCK